MAGSTVDDRLDALDIGLPHSVGTSVGVGDLDTESHALAANIALSHQLHLQSIGEITQSGCAQRIGLYDSRLKRKKQEEITIFSKIFICVEMRPENRYNAR
jgi:hypothetical protein